MTDTTKKRGRGRPIKYDIEQIDATPEQLARAIFAFADGTNKDPEQADHDDDDEPACV